MNLYDFNNLSPFIYEPEPSTNYSTWFQQSDVIPFLEQEITDNDIIIYAALPFAFIHAALIPKNEMTESDINDLLEWNCNPYNTWSLVVSSDEVWIESPLSNSRGEILSKGEQIIFIRSFDGVKSQKNYIELNQKIAHVLMLHYMPERNAWCQLDQYGDLEDVVKVHQFNDLPHKETGTIITIKKRILGEYASVGNLLLCRMYDFTRFRNERFLGWGESHEPFSFSNNKDIFGTLVVDGSNGSYSRGVQIANIDVPKKKIIDGIWGSPEKGKQYATFIALDWKNEQIAEISCNPKCLANYFTKSDLPFEITPAFFRPEVLLKYKTDREKYRLEEQSVSCRGGWELKTFDINKAGQVHTYLVYLSRLPYEEQLHWKQYNEAPKAGLSARAMACDIKGEWHDEHNPLQELKGKLMSIHRSSKKWWVLRSEEALEKALYPFTTSRDEWKEEILNLDQLIVEGFEEKWFRKKVKEVGRYSEDRFRALKLIEECLVGLGFEENHAHEVMEPFHELHNLRSKIKGHASGEDAEREVKEILQKFGSFRKHYFSLCERCNESLEIIIHTFGDN